MAKDTKPVTEITDHDPQGGGSFIRNPDGSLVANETDPQKIPTAEAPAAENIKE